LALTIVQLQYAILGAKHFRNWLYLHPEVKKERRKYNWGQFYKSFFLCCSDAYQKSLASSNGPKWVCSLTLWPEHRNKLSLWNTVLLECCIFIRQYTKSKLYCYSISISSSRYTTEWKGQRLNPGRGEIFNAIQNSPGVQPAFCTRGTSSFPGVKWLAGECCWPPTI
jgi:hypothetical protein